MYDRLIEIGGGSISVREILGVTISESMTFVFGFFFSAGGVGIYVADRMLNSLNVLLDHS